MKKPAGSAIPARRRGNAFKIYYALCAALVAVTSGVAVFASVAPASAATLTETVDPQLAVFLVPLALLMFAMIAEILRAAMAGETAEVTRPKRRIAAWTPGQGEG